MRDRGLEADAGAIGLEPLGWVFQWRRWYLSRRVKWKTVPQLHKTERLALSWGSFMQKQGISTRAVPVFGPR